MVHEALRTLLGALEVVRPAFTRPGFDNLVVVFAGWALTKGPRMNRSIVQDSSLRGRMT
jgi:hypothetical protein